MIGAVNALSNVFQLPKTCAGVDVVFVDLNGGLK